MWKPGDPWHMGPTDTRGPSCGGQKQPRLTQSPWGPGPQEMGDTWGRTWVRWMLRSTPVLASFCHLHCGGARGPTT